MRFHSMRGEDLKRIVLGILFFISLAVCLGCRTSETLPVIKELRSSSDEIYAGQEILVRVELEQFDDTLSVHWTSSSGTITRHDESQIVWEAPKEAGTKANVPRGPRAAL